MVVDGGDDQPSADVSTDNSGDGEKDDRPPANNTPFKKGDKVRVWFRHYQDWFVGIVERLMPASIEVFYPLSTACPDDTYSIHRLRTTQIEHTTPTGAEEQMEMSREANEDVAEAVESGSVEVSVAATPRGANRDVAEALGSDSVEVSVAAGCIGAELMDGILPEEPPKKAKGPRVKLEPPKTPDECGYYNRRFRTGTLRQMLLRWMSGS